MSPQVRTPLTDLASFFIVIIINGIRELIYDFKKRSHDSRETNRGCSRKEPKSQK